MQLRFVMAGTSLADADVDASRGDVLVFPVPRNDRQMGTALLTNRFFTWAVATLRDVRFIARADDDAAFDAGAIAHELMLVSATFGATPNIVYGPFGEWYYWDRDAMMSSCFGYGPMRWLGALKQRALNASATLPRWQAECLKPKGVGPFPCASHHTQPRPPSGTATRCALGRSPCCLARCPATLTLPLAGWQVRQGASRGVRAAGGARACAAAARR